jgi:hypothetical protein
MNLRREGNIKMDLEEMCSEDVDWIHLLKTGASGELL